MAPRAASRGSGSRVPQVPVQASLLALTSYVTRNSHLTYLSLSFLTGKWR